MSLKFQKKSSKNEKRIYKEFNFSNPKNCIEKTQTEKFDDVKCITLFAHCPLRQYLIPNLIEYYKVKIKHLDLDNVVSYFIGLNNEILTKDPKIKSKGFIPFKKVWIILRLMKYYEEEHPQTVKSENYCRAKQSFLDFFTYPLLIVISEKIKYITSCQIEGENLVQYIHNFEQFFLEFILERKGVFPLIEGKDIDFINKELKEKFIRCMSGQIDVNLKILNFQKQLGVYDSISILSDICQNYLNVIHEIDPDHKDILKLQSKINKEAKTLESEFQTEEHYHRITRKYFNQVIKELDKNKKVVSKIDQSDTNHSKNEIFNSICEFSNLLLSLPDLESKEEQYERVMQFRKWVEFAEKFNELKEGYANLSCKKHFLREMNKVAINKIEDKITKIYQELFPFLPFRYVEKSGEVKHITLNNIFMGKCRHQLISKINIQNTKNAQKKQKVKELGQNILHVIKSTTSDVPEYLTIDKYKTIFSSSNETLRFLKHMHQTQFKPILEDKNKWTIKEFRQKSQLLEVLYNLIYGQYVHRYLEDNDVSRLKCNYLLFECFELLTGKLTLQHACFQNKNDLSGNLSDIVNHLVRIYDPLFSYSTKVFYSLSGKPEILKDNLTHYYGTQILIIRTNLNLTILQTNFGMFNCLADVDDENRAVTFNQYLDIRECMNSNKSLLSSSLYSSFDREFVKLDKSNEEFTKWQKTLSRLKCEESFIYQAWFEISDHKEQAFVLLKNSDSVESFFPSKKSDNHFEQFKLFCMFLKFIDTIKKYSKGQQNPRRIKALIENWNKLFENSKESLIRRLITNKLLEFVQLDTVRRPLTQPVVVPKSKKNNKKRRKKKKTSNRSLQSKQPISEVKQNEIQELSEQLSNLKITCRNLENQAGKRDEKFRLINEELEKSRLLNAALQEKVDSNQARLNKEHALNDRLIQQEAQFKFEIQKLRQQASDQYNIISELHSNMKKSELDKKNILDENLRLKSRLKELEQISKIEDVKFNIGVMNDSFERLLKEEKTYYLKDSKTISYETINPSIKKVFVKFREEKIAAYIGGGFVRDFLLGKKTYNDIDFIVFADVNDKKFLRFMANVGFVQNIHYKPLFTFQNIDVCVKDHKMSLKEVANNVDFTLNALYANMQGKIIDPLNAKRDLDNNELKTVHSKTIQEDPFRIFRGIALMLSTQWELSHPLLEEFRLFSRLTIYLPMGRYLKGVLKTFQNDSTKMLFEFLYKNKEILLGLFPFLQLNDLKKEKSKKFCQQMFENTNFGSKYSVSGYTFFGLFLCISMPSFNPKEFDAHYHKKIDNFFSFRNPRNIQLKNSELEENKKMRSAVHPICKQYCIKLNYYNLQTGAENYRKSRSRNGNNRKHAAYRRNK